MYEIWRKYIFRAQNQLVMKLNNRMNALNESEIILNNSQKRKCNRIFNEIRLFQELLDNIIKRIYPTIQGKVCLWS